MANPHGYDKKLFILAFDQRSSFQKKMFGLPGALTLEQTDEIASFKDVIYLGFKRALALGMPGDTAALLCDEQFGDRVLSGAQREGFTFLLAAEKSGQDEFDFEYGDEFLAHIDKYKPTFVKVLIRYNPEGDTEMNDRQNRKLKQLADAVRPRGYKFLIEPLIPATADQLTSVGGDEKRYDLEVRPRLAVAMIKQIQDAGVEVDVWKIEGMELPEEYRRVIVQARTGGRDHVGAVVLGRHAPDDQVERWLTAGKQVEGVLGFAIGRTIFWDPLIGVKEGRIGKEEAAEQMAKKYLHFYHVFAS